LLVDLLVDLGAFRAFLGVAGGLSSSLSSSRRGCSLTAKGKTPIQPQLFFLASAKVLEGGEEGVAADGGLETIRVSSKSLKIFVLISPYPFLPLKCVVMTTMTPLAPILFTAILLVTYLSSDFAMLQSSGRLQRGDDLWTASSSE
jgi:hypothetical protein